MEGHYEKRGDIEEWVWEDEPRPTRKIVTTKTAEAVVPPKKRAATKQKAPAKRRAKT
jgi:hypothetical protein